MRKVDYNKMQKVVYFIGVVAVLSIAIASMMHNNKLMKENLQLECRIIELEVQRDLLSDALRNTNDLLEDNTCLEIAENYLKIDSCDLDSLYSWSYCY